MAGKPDAQVAGACPPQPPQCRWDQPSVTIVRWSWTLAPAAEPSPGGQVTDEIG